MWEHTLRIQISCWNLSNYIRCTMVVILKHCMSCFLMKLRRKQNLSYDFRALVGQWWSRWQFERGRHDGVNLPLVLSRNDRTHFIGYGNGILNCKDPLNVVPIGYRYSRSAFLKSVLFYKMNFIIIPLYCDKAPE